MVKYQSLTVMRPHCLKGKQQGQVILEYILLMLITLTLATFLMKSLVSRSTDETGVLMKKWQSLIEQVASDDPNKRH